MIILTISLCVVFVVHIYLTRLSTKRYFDWKNVILYVALFDVPWMSHLWHLAFGEDRIGDCDERQDIPFGWYPCFEPDWNTFVNTYEFTLMIEFIFFTSMVFIMLPKYETTIGVNPIPVLVLNGMHLILVLMLSFGPPSFLDGFVFWFDLLGFLFSLALVLFLEYSIYKSRIYTIVPHTQPKSDTA